MERARLNPRPRRVNSPAERRGYAHEHLEHGCERVLASIPAMTFDQGRWRDVEAERASGHHGADGRGAPAPLLVGGKWCDLTGTIDHDGPFKPGTGSRLGIWMNGWEGLFLAVRRMGCFR